MLQGEVHGDYIAFKKVVEAKLYENIGILMLEFTVQEK
jgi:hypothetical protein